MLHAYMHFSKLTIDTFSYLHFIKINYWKKQGSVITYENKQMIRVLD